MNSPTFAIDMQVYGAVLFGLTMFGLAYNVWIGWLGDRKEGYTALLVMIGVAVTLIGVAIISWQSALLVLGAFAASGTPMIAGDIYRAVKAREDAKARIAAEIARKAGND